MKGLIKAEYKKMWNGITMTALAALSILTILFSLITLNIQQRTIDKNGNIVSGLPAFRALKEASADLDGVMDGEYIQKLIEEYNGSIDKQYLEENRGFLGTGGMTKYILTNYLINYAYYSAYMSNGNDKIGLDYDFLSSEDSFYRKYKEAVMEQMLCMNEWNGLVPYTEQQINVLEKKVENIKTPFRVAYHTGISNFNSYFKMEYPVFFILLAFCLSSVYAKDSSNGMDELVLASKHGRKIDMRARWIAGDLFTVTAYLIFVGMLLLVHGAIGTLHGMDASIQTFIFECLYNINVATGEIILILGGLAGALVMSNLVMLLSIKLKNAKLVTIAGIVIVGLLIKQAATYSQIKMFNPMQFKESALLVDYLFIGNAAVPYFMIVLLLSIIYIAICKLLLRQSYRKYRLN